MQFKHKLYGSCGEFIPFDDLNNSLQHKGDQITENDVSEQLKVVRQAPKINSKIKNVEQQSLQNPKKVMHKQQQAQSTMQGSNLELHSNFQRTQLQNNAMNTDKEILRNKDNTQQVTNETRKSVVWDTRKNLDDREAPTMAHQLSLNQQRAQSQAKQRSKNHSVMRGKEFSNEQTPLTLGKPIEDNMLLHSQRGNLGEKNQEREASSQAQQKSQSDKSSCSRRSNSVQTDQKPTNTNTSIYATSQMQASTPTNANKFFIVPSASSVRQSREHESSVAYDEEDYKSMWADISQHTMGQSHYIDDENGTEYSGIFQINQLRSDQNKTDLNESMCSASQASYSATYGVWANDSSFVEDDSPFPTSQRTPTSSMMSNQKKSSNQQNNQNSSCFQKHLGQPNQATHYEDLKAPSTPGHSSSFSSDFLFGPQFSEETYNQLSKKGPWAQKLMGGQQQIQTQQSQPQTPKKSQASSSVCSSLSNYVMSSNTQQANQQMNQKIYGQNQHNMQKGTNSMQQSSQNTLNLGQSQVYQQNIGKPIQTVGQQNLAGISSGAPQVPSPKNLSSLNMWVQQMMQYYRQNYAYDRHLQECIEQISQIPDNIPRIQAQYNLIQEIQRMQKQKMSQNNQGQFQDNSQQSNSLLQSSYPPYVYPHSRQGINALNERRDSSISSQYSSSSSASSNSRSLHSQNLKNAFATATRDFSLLVNQHDRRRFLIDKAYIFARDKQGCQLLQNWINEEITHLQQQINNSGLKHKNCQQQSCQFVEDVLNELLQNRDSTFHKLMMHPSANFLCQTLFQHGSSSQLEKVIETIKNDFCKISMDQHGTRALQCLLDECISRHTGTPYNKNAVKKLGKILSDALEKGNKTFEMCMNMRGNHVIKQAMHLMNQNQTNRHVYSLVFNKFAVLSTDQNGCQVVQQCISQGTNAHRNDMAAACQEQIDTMINDEYGNFVVQWLLEHATDANETQIAARWLHDYIASNISHFSFQQFSSRVVETGIKVMCRESFEILCNTFTDKRTKKQRLFREILFDQFGNYIAPKIIERSRKEGFTRAYEHFLKTFEECREHLYKLKHGRQLVNKIKEAQGGYSKNKHGKSGQGIRGNNTMSSSSSVASLSSKNSRMSMS